MTFSMTIELKISKCGNYLVTRSVCAGKGYITEHPKFADIFTYFGFGILIQYKT
jgi:hypothetical protein